MAVQICLYGFGVVGMAFFHRWLNELSAERKKYEIVCIVDKNKNDIIECNWYSQMNIPTFSSIEEAKALIRFDKVLITATMPSSVLAIRNSLAMAGIKDESIEQYSANEVYIDVSGKCNLRCKSCQVSIRNTKYVDYDKRTPMTKDLFEKIVIKLKNELDDFQYIYLYIFGEPLLNPWLPDIVRIAHKYDLLAIISTNLSLKTNIEELMESKPDCIKVSVSGFSQEVYSSTHTGGNIDLVKSNLDKISSYNRMHEKFIPIVVGYHGYKNNQGAEKERMKQFCARNNIFFQYVKAGYYQMVKQWKMLEYTDEDLSFVKTLYDNPEEILYPPVVNSKRDCYYIENGVFIDYKGDITLCCISLNDSAQYGNFLCTSLEEAKLKREKSELCTLCRKYGMQS